MPKLSDVENTPLSHYNHIDALLNSSPHWNYFQPKVANTLLYSFAVPTEAEDSIVGPTAFTPTQQFYARLAIAELAKYTGIRFVETQNGEEAQIKLCNADIQTSANTMGLASWQYGWDEPGPGLYSNYVAWGTLYMDSKEFGASNADLSPGTAGYETLLHELGHLMGLKHPFETTEDNTAVLPAGQDGKFFTVMAYSTFSAPGITFAQYDIAALRWLYGGDGLGGARGVGGTGGVYLTGTPFADNLNGSPMSDLLEGGGGNDVINGGAGIDFVNVNVARHLLTVTRTAEGFSVDDGTSVDQLINVERVLYTGGVIALDIDGIGGQAYRIYNAVLNRVPDSAGLGFWINGMDNGMSLRDVAGHFMQGEEFRTNFGVNLSNSQLVTTLYQNILDRAPEQAGVDYWVGALESGAISQADALAMISESAENRGQVDPTISNGFSYAPWA